MKNLNGWYSVAWIAVGFAAWWLLMHQATTLGFWLIVAFSYFYGFTLSSIIRDEERLKKEWALTILGAYFAIFFGVTRWRLP